ncbi:YdeI/OmpD-associated family protein [Pontibacter russatus]|uniref:YdeI/OmpD-associated family protein n=1 Tax=Pontibacter russatus TaxID=2694929 RepID=UPI0013799ACF|nr:YdeI/OmpD-associated family protein [Pontibacter russatus]
MPELKKKLQLRAATELLLLHAPEEMATALTEEGVAVVRAGEAPATGAYEAVLLFVQRRQQLEQEVPQATALLKLGGLLWIAYPKKSSGIETDLTRDEGWRTMAELGYEPVRQVALNAIWSALRFRHRSERKTASTFGVDTPGIDRKTKTVVVPDDLQQALEEAGLSERFSQLAFTHRKEHVVAVLEAKRPETRASRIRKIVQQLSLRQQA